MTPGPIDRLADDLTPDATYRLADEQIRAGSLDRALGTLDGLAATATAGGDELNQVRALRLAACTARLRGDLPGAVDRARRCLAVVPDPAADLQPVRLQAMLDLAGWLLELEDAAAAVPLLRQVLGEIPPDDRSQQAAVQRRLAAALVALGHRDQARLALAAAGELATDDASSARIAVDVASLGYVLADPVGDALAGRARAQVESLADPGALTQLALLDAARELDAGRPAEALTALARARALALDAVLPVEYLTASVGIAQICDRLGDRAGAYASLATGWATVGDLLGPDVARTTFAPQLRSLKERWGDSAFAAARAAYENRTRPVGRPGGG